MKLIINSVSTALLSALLLGCSGGAGDPSPAQGAAAQNSFSRPLSDAEKAKMGGQTPTSGAAAAPGKKPVGG